MEEELNENELEERLYSILHYADDTQGNLNVNHKDVPQIVDTAPRSTIRRYWHTNEEHSIYRKVNTPKIPPASKNIVTDKTDSKLKPEKRDVVPTPPSTNLPSMFQSPISQNLKRTIEIVENDVENNQIVALESSDDDEVVEVALPPKTTITIESSDEDEVCAINEVKPKDVKETISPGKKSLSDEDISASPVPSVVSSVSDEFIRGDCIALNISSRYPSNQSFDFSLHGSDLLVQTPSKKKKKKKNKDANTSTPIASTPTTNVQQTNTPTSNKEEYFATPKSKAKNKRQKNKSYLVSDKSLPNPDVYDSDSNQSVTEINKNPSNSEENKGITQSDTMSDPSEDLNPKETVSIVDTETEKMVIPKDKHEDVNLKSSKRVEPRVVETTDIVDLTNTSEQDMSLITIDENIVMGNVSGFANLEEYNDNLSSGDAPKFGSTKVPEILYADLDFNNLNGKERASKRRRYSLTTLRAEMEKFYNESWGGENFNHREIQKYMSRDKSLWVIDPKDRISALSKRKVTCNYCNRQGHRDDTCRLKPPVCYMCGSMGHREPRCPRKICVNCGSPNHMYSTMCRNCYHWHGITCSECGQSGHPASHCPDLWRRYHNTISEDTPLEENHQVKKNYQIYCSGCTKRGHLVHTCRSTVPFSGLPINSPYVAIYQPIYSPENDNQSATPTSQPTNTTQYKNIQQDDTVTCGSISRKTDRNKRQSKSPVVHETHVNKKRNLSGTELTDVRVNTMSPVNNGQKRKTSQSKDILEDDQSCNKEILSDPKTTVRDPEKAPDFIPLFSGNHDKQGQIIQDNEVSDTSDVVITARIYVTANIMDKLNTAEGQQWLNATADKNNVAIQKTDISFLVINGSVGNQEAFQSEFRDWIKKELKVEFSKSDKTGDTILGDDQALSNNIPKNRRSVLSVINRALKKLETDIGDPKSLLKEYNYLQNRHMQLLKQKTIGPKQLSASRTNLNSILRKLNMVLLGQAGLADGPQHLNKLCTLHEKLTNFRQKIIPNELRQEIGQHFHSIFTGIPREDYADLVSKYYVSKNTEIFSKNSNISRLKINPKPIQNKTINHLKLNGNNTRPDLKDNGGILDFKKPQMRSSPFVEKTVNKLTFYHKRLLNVNPVDAVLKKTKKTLMDRLHFHISSLDKKRHMSSKTLKKTRKIQEQAQLFLTNV